MCDGFRLCPAAAMRQLRWPYLGCSFLGLHAHGPNATPVDASQAHATQKLWPCKPMHDAVFQSPCAPDDPLATCAESCAEPAFPSLHRALSFAASIFHLPEEGEQRQEGLLRDEAQEEGEGWSQPQEEVGEERERGHARTAAAAMPRRDAERCATVEGLDLKVCFFTLALLSFQVATGQDSACRS